ncbi:molybdate ABC transporter substrate-binding protein [Demequina sp.]|uniref:molybdate ABC transporter substrate-binding protein n=1 Tax=Demequina sp. TaxID=2050685 RepID=UPI0025EF0076|nr:molybdate ABC transporter substrate-binding protein [Demequina sp.]
MSRGPGIAIAALGIAIIGAVIWASSTRDAVDARAHAEGRVELTVFAAASLADVMEPIAEAFESAHGAVDVRLTYGGSSDLAAQIAEGAPAEVFVSADEAQMAAVADHVSGDAAVVATNTLTLVVPAGNPAGVRGLEDLASPGLVSVICAPQVPCGAGTAELATLAGVTLTPASEEQSVTGVLGKVASGQADAGIVYVTDIARAEGVEAVEIDGADAVVNHYMAAALTGAREPGLPALFVEFLTGPEAREVLAAAGFGTP